MKRACVVGWPIKHSRSPLIHRHWLKRYGIEGDYLREAVEPEHFEAFLKGLAGRGYVGCNVTIPHKERAFALMDALDPVAERLGAVNTVWLEGGRLHGMNTDVPGFLANLDDGAPGWDREADHVLVLGAGGAARGLVHGLLSRGAGTVTVANRSREKAEAIAAEFGGSVSAIDLDAVPARLGSVDLLVNATALGMAGQPDLDLDLSGLKPSAIVTDIVYVPLETTLLKQAAARGHRTVGGLGMLLHQAVPGFQTWFGVRPEVTPELYDLIAADVREKG